MLLRCPPILCFDMLLCCCGHSLARAFAAVPASRAPRRLCGATRGVCGNGRVFHLAPCTVIIAWRLAGLCGGWFLWSPPHLAGGAALAPHSIASRVYALTDEDILQCSWPGRVPGAPWMQPRLWRRVARGTARRRRPLWHCTSQVTATPLYCHVLSPFIRTDRDILLAARDIQFTDLPLPAPHVWRH